MNFRGVPVDGANRMRDEMTTAGDQDKFDELINEARDLQNSLLGDRLN